MKNRFLLLLVSGLVCASPVFAAGKLSLLEAGSHCVAYKAKKRLFLISTVSVVGRSCEVSVQVTPELGGKYHIEISFPVKSLKSGEDKRDADVWALLGAEKSPELLFVSHAMSAEEWLAHAAKGAFSVKGELKIAGEKHPLVATVAVSRGAGGVEVDGVVKTSFKELSLKPPKLAFGLGATVKNDLELHFHFMGQRTLGADSIFK